MTEENMSEILDEVEVDTVKAAKSKPKSASKPKKDITFNEKAYKVLRQEEEMIERPVVERGRIISARVPTGRLIEVEVFNPEYIKENLTLHIAKCRYRAAKAIGVSVDHLKKAYYDLNGKKIDGFFVTDLIDRYGFSNGEQMSRDMLRKKYKLISVASVEMAFNKLKDIISKDNVLKAYADHINDVKDEMVKDLRDKSVYGEMGDK